ncbi:FNTA family protein [Megaselia abdita]
MSDNSDDELMPDWIPYSHRPEWSDVTPLAQDDGPYPVVQIAYSEKFSEVYDYFRAILAANEKSERALKLTQDALQLNPANYTVWQYRREILKDLKKDLHMELEYLDNIIENNTKNYQVWHHRRVIVDQLNDPIRELPLTENVLKMDPKNYHAWQHRQYAIKKFNLYDDELAYVDRLITEDIRNNSAWNQRFFVLKHFGFTSEILGRELQYTTTRIKRVPNNESAWNFLRGLLSQCEGAIDQSSYVNDFCEELYESGGRFVFLLAFLIDLNERRYMQCEEESKKAEFYKKIEHMCTILSTDHDSIRQNYWQYMLQRIRSN